MILFLKDPACQHEVIDLIINKLRLSSIDIRGDDLKLKKAHFLIKIQSIHNTLSVDEVYYVKQGMYYYITSMRTSATVFTQGEVQYAISLDRGARYYIVTWEDLLVSLQSHPVYGGDCQIPSDLIEEVHPGNPITGSPAMPTIHPSVEVGNSYIVQANSIAINGNTLFTQVKKETTMEKIMNQNVTAAKTVANLTAGKVINKKLIKELSKMLPKSAKGVLKHPIAEIVLANAVAVAIDKFAPGNKKAAYVKEACLTAAYANTEAFLGIESLISGLLDQVTLPDFTDED
jgi:hypothetical protein